MHKYKKIDVRFGIKPLKTLKRNFFLKKYRIENFVQFPPSPRKNCNRTLWSLIFQHHCGVGGLFECGDLMQLLR